MPIGQPTPSYEYDLFKGGALLDSLAAVGAGPEQITDVIYTHLHLDHLGWSRVNDASTFPNATHHCHQADLGWFTDPANTALSVKLAIDLGCRQETVASVQLRGPTGARAFRPCDPGATSS